MTRSSGAHEEDRRPLFHTVKGGAGYDLWKRFDPGLARQLSMFFRGTLYSREVIPQRERELCGSRRLTVLNRTHELRAHIHAALNVGARPAGKWAR